MKSITQGKVSETRSILWTNLSLPHWNGKGSWKVNTCLVSHLLH